MNKKNNYSYFENRDCEYYPCHAGTDELNCLFCYCPMYRFEKCLGNPEYKEKSDGHKVKVCTRCTFPHNRDNYSKVMEYLRNNI